MTLLRLAAKPVESIAGLLHCRLHRSSRSQRAQMTFRFMRRHWVRSIILHRKTISVAVGVAFMAVATMIYEHHPSMLPKGFWEMSAFGLHGFGAAPIIRIVADAIGLEI